jgi:hypothetical protein
MFLNHAKSKVFFGFLSFTATGASKHSSRYMP